MTQPTFHPVSQQHLDLMRQSLPQSLLLVGPDGVGLSTAALYLAGDTLVSVIEPTNDSTSKVAGISIETIRRLYGQTRGKHTRPQVYVIDDADMMSSAAQNAFLKLLEEPNPSIRFILTSHTPQKLLPTITSRTQQCLLHPITQEQTTAFIESLTPDEKKRQQLHFMASGLPAELLRLTANEDYFAERARFVTAARDFLLASPYKKLLIVNQYQTSRPDALRLLDTAIAIARRSATAKPQQQLLQQLNKLLDARERIAANQSIRLQLARIVL